MGGGEAHKGEELGKELTKGACKDNVVSEEDQQNPMLLQYLLEEGAAEADQ